MKPRYKLLLLPIARTCDRKGNPFSRWIHSIAPERDSDLMRRLYAGLPVDPVWVRDGKPTGGNLDMIAAILAASNEPIPGTEIPHWVAWCGTVPHWEWRRANPTDEEGTLYPALEKAQFSIPVLEEK